MPMTTSAVPRDQLADRGRQVLNQRRAQKRQEGETLIAAAREKLFAAESDYSEKFKIADRELAPARTRVEQARAALATVEAQMEGEDAAAVHALARLLSPIEKDAIEKLRRDLNDMTESTRNSVGDLTSPEAAAKAAARVRALMAAAGAIPELRLHENPLGEVAKLRQQLAVPELVQALESDNRNLNRQQTAIHEAGHAVALLANGHRVRDLVIYASGVAGCRPDSWDGISLDDRLLAAFAGPTADRLLAGGSGELSLGDLAIIEDHLATLWPAARRHLGRHVEAFVATHQQAIRRWRPSCRNAAR